MKKIPLLIIILTFVINVSAQDKQAVLKVMDSQLTAWNRGDISGFMQGYWHSDSLMFVGSKGPTYGWQKTLDNYKQSYPDKAAMGILAFKIIQVNFINAANAFVLGAWHLKREKTHPAAISLFGSKKLRGSGK